MGFIRELFGLDVAAKVQRIMAAAEDADPLSVEGATARLVALGLPAVPQLLHFLGHDRPRCRQLAVAALGDLLDPDTFSAVERLTADKDEHVSGAAKAAVSKLQAAVSEQHRKLREAAMAEGTYRCDWCHRSSDEVFRDMKEAHLARYGPSGPGLVQIGALVAVCPGCRKAWCTNHLVAADPHDFFSNPKCPRCMVDLDEQWAGGMTEATPWRLGPAIEKKVPLVGRVSVGECTKCGKAVRVKAQFVRPGLQLTCKCGQVNTLGPDSRVPTQAP
ncbi:MAG TPA: hypothetical protein VLH75_14280 [Longimicrobiales bacterium]|nr:hypothetical protein [Longimicrobiales bacterium]